eukprot:scaffold1462_cov260-Pinguiococcus_pyrenoidosus.AAC.6
MEFLNLGAPTNAADRNLWTAAGDGDLVRRGAARSPAAGSADPLRSPQSAVQQLIGASHQGVNAQDENGYACLHAAASYGHVALAQWLLEQRADCNIRDTEGDTPLHYCESAAVAQMLLSHGTPSLGGGCKGVEVGPRSPELCHRCVCEGGERRGADAADDGVAGRARRDGGLLAERGRPGAGGGQRVEETTRGRRRRWPGRRRVPKRAAQRGRGRAGQRRRRRRRAHELTRHVAILTAALVAARRAPACLDGQRLQLVGHLHKLRKGVGI